MTLSVANGTLLLAQTTGLTFTLGANGSSTMRFQGTLPAINLALDNDGNGPNGLKYTPNANFNGADVLIVTTNDLNSTGIPGGPQQDTDTVSIIVNPVNDTPSISFNGNTINNAIHGTLPPATPPGQVVLEGTTVVFNAANSSLISATDVDNPTGNMVVRLTASRAGNERQLLNVLNATGGTFTLSLGAVGVTTTGPLNFNATATDIQNALQGLTAIGAGNVSVTGPVNGQYTIQFVGALASTDVGQVTANGSGLTGSSPTAAVTTAVNGNQFTGALTLGSTSGLNFGNGNDTITNDDGILDSDMEFSGTLANVLNALNGLQFIPAADFSGTASFKIFVNDNGQTGIDPSGAAIGVGRVNDIVADRWRFRGSSSHRRYRLHRCERRADV